MAIGIDVSENNGEIDWDSVLDAGVEFAIIRAGWGQGHEDEMFVCNADNALEHGLKIGGYWFSYALNEEEAYQEGRYCRDIIDSWGGIMTLPIFYDQESSSWRDNNGWDPACATAQCDEFADGLSLNTGVYANLDWFINKLDYDYLFSKYNGNIWLAEYGDECNLPCGIWQFTDHMDINGKAFDGNTAQL